MNPFITVSQHEDSKENKKYNAMIMIETACISLPVYHQLV